MDAETHVRGFIDKNWPELYELIPADASFHEESRWAAFHTHGLQPEKWVHSRSGKWFAADESVPDGYFACGLQNGGGSEYLFVLWEKDGRRFAFYEQYVVYMVKEGASVEKTAVALKEAMNAWEQGGDIVVFSGPWGWFNPDENRFELDSMNEASDGEMGKIMEHLSERGEAQRPDDIPG